MDRLTVSLLKITVLGRSLFLLILMTTMLTVCGQPVATKVAIRTDPVPGAVNGGLMSVQPVVEIREATDLLVTGSTAQVEIVIISGTGGSLGGTTRISAVNGVATFTDLTFTGLTGQSYTFEFRSNPVIVSDPFAYTGGASLTGQNGGFGWSGSWFGPSTAFADYTVNATGLTYPGFSTSGGRAAYTSGTGGDGGRRLAAASNAAYNVVWLAFLGNYTQQGGGFNNVRLFNSSTLTGGIGGNDNYADWTILNNSLNATTFTAAPMDGTTRLALLKIDYTAGNSSLWMDPAVASFDGTQTPSITANFAPVFDEIDFYNRTSDVSTDEITLASTYKAALHLEQNLVPATSTVSVLPVKWTFFTTACIGVQILLEWGTADETNNSHFIVERSSDGIHWLSIGKVQGAGNSGIDQQYQFKDSANSAMTYYRLQQVDLDGNADFSKIISANCGTPRDTRLSVFPNPARDVIQLNGARPGLRYELMDVRGRAVRTGLIQSSSMSISLNGIPGGNYFLIVEGSDSLPVSVVKVGL
jgi:hypothetical protein